MPYPIAKTQLFPLFWSSTEVLTNWSNLGVWHKISMQWLYKKCLVGWVLLLRIALVFSLYCSTKWIHQHLMLVFHLLFLHPSECSDFSAFGETTRWLGSIIFFKELAECSIIVLPEWFFLSIIAMNRILSLIHICFAKYDIFLHSKIDSVSFACVFGWLMRLFFWLQEMEDLCIIRKCSTIRGFLHLIIF